MIKKGDFIEIDFVGRIKSTNQIFDLTLAEVAKKEGISQQNQEYKPLVACLGASHFLKGLDEFLEGKEVGKEYELELPAEKAFGKRNPKLIQLTGLKIFKEKKVNPFPGMQLMLDGAVATVRSVSGGRVILDFNHTLSGKALTYWIKINRKVEKPEEQIQGIADLLGIKDLTIKVTEDKADIKSKDKLPDNIKKGLEGQIKKLVSKVKEVKFI